MHVSNEGWPAININRVAIAALLAVTLGATAAFGQESPGTVQAGIDANPEGNSAAVLGTIDACRGVQVGETFDIDVWVKDVPTAPLGLGGFGYNFHFDPALVKVTAVSNEFLIQTGTPFQIIDGDFTAGDNSDPLPATTGNMRLDYGQIGGTPSSGDGIVSRITLEALAAGRSELTLTDDQSGRNTPVVLTKDGTEYVIGQLENAVVEIGAACEPATAPTPIIFETPPPSTGGATGTPAPDDTGDTTPTTAASPDGATSVPAGSTSLAIDAIPEGNRASSVGSIEVCATANVGDAFNVDIVVDGVEDLLAFESTLSYDPEVLKVTGRNTELLLASQDGSQVVDTSAQTPDDSGQYTAGGVDTADPLSPESGAGVLVRLTMEAVADGTSPLSIGPVDLNDDNHADRGTFLRNADGNIIGDEDNDTFFDGDIADAEIRVGEACADADARVVLLEEDSGPSSTPSTTSAGDDDGGGSLLWILLGIAAVVLALAGGVWYFMMRGRGTPAP